MGFKLLVPMEDTYLYSLPFQDLNCLQSQICYNILTTDKETDGSWKVYDRSRIFDIRPETKEYSEGMTLMWNE